MSSIKPGKVPKFRKNFEQILSTNSLNILFVIDTTGSMDPYRDLCSESISLITKKLSTANTLFRNRTACVKLGVIAYRDKKDKVPFEYLDFTNEEEKVISFVKNLDCEGGGDACEDVKGAFKQVPLGNNIHWDAQFKFVVMIADAPCHGKIYHDLDSKHDDFPDENMEEEVKQMALNDLNFIGILFTPHTQKMYQEIEKIYLGNHGSFRLIEHKDLQNIKSHEKCTQNILNLFVDQISKPVQELTISTIKTFLEEKKISRPTPFNFMEENAKLLNFEWIAEDEGNFFDEEIYEVFNLACDPKSIDFKNIEAFDISSIKINEWKCKITINAIGKGCFRSIFLVKVLKENPQKDDKTPYNLYIAKAPIKDMYYKNPEEVKSEWRGSLIAGYMARRFNSDLYGVGNKGDLTVSFNDIFILKSKKSFSLNGKEQFKYYAVEKVLKGNFTKYNNNFDFVADLSKYKDKLEEMFLFNEVAQAFSHYTFQKSDGYILVCDLQGVVQKLTDPMILTKNKTKLQGDLAGPGIAQFFATHQCNEICQKLKLEKMKDMITDDLMKQISEIKELKKAEDQKYLKTITSIESDEENHDEESKNEEETKTNPYAFRGFRK